MSLLYKRGWPRMIPMMHLQGREGFGWIWYFRWASFWRQPTGGATLAQWQYDNMWYMWDLNHAWLDFHVMFFWPARCGKLAFMTLLKSGGSRSFPCDVTVKTATFGTEMGHSESFVHQEIMDGIFREKMLDQPVGFDAKGHKGHNSFLTTHNSQTRWFSVFDLKTLPAASMGFHPHSASAGREPSVWSLTAKMTCRSWSRPLDQKWPPVICHWGSQYNSIQSVTKHQAEYSGLTTCRSAKNSF